MSAHQLTIFYDGHCPLCALEMEKLKSLDSKNLINLENIHQSDFADKFPAIDQNAALAMLHGYYKKELLIGLDVTYRAWSLVGKTWLVFPLRVPVFRTICQLAYKFFARYRHQISHFCHHHLGMGKKQCNKGACYDKTNNAAHRR